MAIEKGQGHFSSFSILEKHIPQPWNTYLRFLSC